MKRYLFSGILLSITFIYCYSADNKCNQIQATSTTDANWMLVFQDDFNGSVVNQNNWSMYDSPGHAGNGLRRQAAFSVQDGMLVVTAQMQDGKLVSGGMAHKTNYTYGKFEFRIRTEADPSSATSGVVLTWPKSEKWPVDGENDIYETLTSSTRGLFHTYIHYGADNRQYHFEHKVDAIKWHTIGMVWTKDSIDIYRDGQLVYNLTDTNANPKVAHHMCIQLDAFRTTMNGTVRMFVDWVKIYQQGAVSEINFPYSGNNVNIFPNPVIDYMDVKLSNNADLQSLDIYNIDGIMIKSTQTGLPKIDCSGLKAGLYLLKVNLKLKTEVVKFVKS